MAQTVTFVTLAVVAVAALVWVLRRTVFKRDTVAVSVRLDRDAPGAHLIWDIVNAGQGPITVTKLIIHGKDSTTPDAVSLALPQLLRPEEGVLLPTDVDWTLLSARSIAVGDAAGGEHVVSRKQLNAIQRHLRSLIDRREDQVSAREFLFVGTDLAFGVVILGLGFFMLMWVIATG